MIHKSYSAKTIVLEGGERFPLVIYRETGLPHGSATDYAIQNLRTKPINTSLKAMDAIALFLSWVESREIDLEERFGSFRLFSNQEISALAEFLYVNFRQQGGRLPPKRVVGAHQGSRIDAIWAYIEWRAGNIISKLSKKDAEVNICNNKLKALNKQIKKVRGSSKSIERGMLTIDQYHRLIQIVKPGSPENPFQKQNQLRNYLIFLAYGEFGIRRAEILTMKGRHLSIGPNSTVLVTFTPNDPHDPRIKTPSVKTKSRILPMSNHMAGCFVDLLKQRRTNSRIANAAKKTEFIMLSSHTGKPLSIDAVDHIFVVIRERFPDEFPDNFGPHHLRRTWNYRFSAMCKEKGIKKEEENKLRKYGMGWSENSKQPEKYNRAAIEEQTAELLIAMQNRMTG